MFKVNVKITNKKSPRHNIIIQSDSVTTGPKKTIILFYSINDYNKHYWTVFVCFLSDNISFKNMLQQHAKCSLVV